MIKDIYPGIRNPSLPPFFQEGNSSVPQNFVNVDGVLFFTANDGVHGQELWKSDGTAEGTSMVIDLTPGSASTQFSYGSSPISYCEFLAVNNLLFFTARTPSTSGSTFDHSLYVTDGTAEGTSAVLTFNNMATNVPPISELTFDGQRLYFRAGIHFVGSGTPDRFTLFAIDIVPEPNSISLVFFALCGMATARRSRASCRR